MERFEKRVCVRDATRKQGSSRVSAEGEQVPWDEKELWSRSGLAKLEKSEMADEFEPIEKGDSRARLA